MNSVTITHYTYFLHTCRSCFRILWLLLRETDIYSPIIWPDHHITGQEFAETASELKKVNWPTAGSVIKKTGIVLAVVLIFAVVLFGIDRLLSWLFELLTNPMV